MAEVFEQDIILDADGKPLFSALDYVNAQVAKLQLAINQIGKDSFKNVNDVGKVIASQTAALQAAMGQLRTLASAKNTPGAAIQDLNANRKLAGATVEAAKYAQILGVGSTAAEHLQAKLNSLNQTIAELGKAGKFPTLDMTRQLEQTQTQIKQLRQLDSEYDRINRKAGRTGAGADFSVQQAAIKAARDKLTAAARTPGQFDLSVPINEARAAQDALTEAVQRTRRARAEELSQMRLNTASQRALAPVYARDAVESKGFSGAQLGATYEREIALLEVQNAVTAEQKTLALDKLKIAQANLAAVNQLVSAETKEVEVERQRNALAERTSNQATKASAPIYAREAVATSGYDGALIGAKLERELAYNELQKAQQGNNQILTAQALEQLKIADANVAAVQRLVAEENRELSIERQRNEEIARGQRADQRLTVGSFASGQIGALGPETARAAAKARLLDLEERLHGAEEAEKGPLRDALALEQRRTAEIERQIGAKNKEEAGTIGGRAKKALTNTALYGVVAGVGYAAFNQVQQQITDMVQLEDEFVKLQAISNSTDIQMQQLKGTIFAIGDTSRFALVDIAKIAQSLAQAGVSAGDMDKVLRSVTTLATASGSTPDEAVNLVTSALGSFQLQASEAGRVADLLTSALNRTKLTVGQVGQAIQYVGATAFEQNISLEQLLATVGAIAQAGVKSGSTIGTGFRQFLVDLSNPSEKLTAQLTALGLKASDVNVSVNGLPAVLDKLRTSGFGAAQAYAGLETRAAAFYLTAKNNVDIMDELQLSFATSGAAAVANERAMNSLTAQWQRFKNVITDGLSGSFDSATKVLQNVLDDLSTKIQQMNDAAKNLGEKGSLNDYVKQSGGLVSGFAGFDENVIQPKFVSVLEHVLDLLNIGSKEDGLGTYIRKLGEDSNGAADGSEKLATQLAESSDAVDKQRNLVSELQKEYQRLIVQKASLVDNDRRSAVETANLTARFPGLALQLDSTKSRYESLTNAVLEFTKAQTASLNGNLSADNSNLILTKNQAGRVGGAAIQSLQNNPVAQGILKPAEKAALETLKTVSPSSAAGSNAEQVLAAGLDRIVKVNEDVAKQVNIVVQSASTIATTNSTLSTNKAAMATNSAQATPLGAAVFQTNNQVQALITQLSSADRGDKTALSKQALGLLDVLDRKLATAKPRGGSNTAGDLRYIKDTKGDMASLRQQIMATLMPTKAEIAEAKTADRQARAEERAARKPTQADLDSIGKAHGLGLGRANDDSPAAKAVEDSLHARGLTKATGATSGHTKTGGIARDFLVGSMSDQEAEAVATSMRAEAAQKGIKAYIKFENGKGKNNGTGRHIHADIRGGSVKGDDKTEVSKDQYQADLLNDQVGIDKTALADQLKKIGKAVDQASFDTAIAASNKAIDTLKTDLTAAAEQDLRVHGIAEGSDQWKAKMDQVQQTVEEATLSLNAKIADTMAKNITAQIKAADKAFAAAVQPAKAAVDLAASQVSGLDYFSNDGLVPDYVKTLATRRKAQADENLDRSKLANLPGRIDAQQATLTASQARLSKIDPDVDPANYATASQAVQDLTDKLVALKDERDALAAGLSAGTDLIPTSLTEGAQKAIEAYTAVNHLSNTFTQDLNQNMTGALDAVNSGLTDFFTNILSGSQTALQAFGGMAKGLLSYMTQLAAKLLASKLFGLLLGAVGGSPAAATGAGEGINNVSKVLGFGSFNGGPAVPTKGLLGGGEVMNGSDKQDSVTKSIAKGEWVVRKKAVDSVGNKFMAQLNQHGAAALSSLNAVPQIAMAPKQEMAVYVVAPDHVPQMTKNDVLLAVHQDILSGGETKKLIKYVGQGN